MVKANRFPLSCKPLFPVSVLFWTLCSASLENVAGRVISRLLMLADGLIVDSQTGQHRHNMFCLNNYHPLSCTFLTTSPSTLGLSHCELVIRTSLSASAPTRRTASMPTPIHLGRPRHRLHVSNNTNSKWCRLLLGTKRQKRHEFSSSHWSSPLRQPVI